MQPAPSATVSVHRALSAWPEWRSERLDEAITRSDGTFAFRLGDVTGLLIKFGHASYAGDLVEVPRHGGLDLRLEPAFELSGFVTTDGGLPRPPTPIDPPQPYPISYRALVPKRGECSNLLVPVCVSATHVTYGSIRMEPVFMVLGQSAGSAAVLAVEGKVAVQDVPYATLRQALLDGKQALTWPAP